MSNSCMSNDQTHLVSSLYHAESVAGLEVASGSANASKIVAQAPTTSQPSRTATPTRRWRTPCPAVRAPRWFSLLHLFLFLLCVAHCIHSPAASTSTPRAHCQVAVHLPLGCITANKHPAASGQVHPKSTKESAAYLP